MKNAHSIQTILRATVPEIYSALECQFQEHTRGEDFFYVPGNKQLPLLVAHIDTVFPPPSIVYHDRAENVYWSPGGLGADDRAGVYALLELKNRFVNGNGPALLFCDKEETGGMGAYDAAYTLADELVEYPFMIELDRQGKQDCIFYNGEGKKFRRYIRSFGFSDAHGTFSDVSVLGGDLGVSSVNLSCGYYGQHTKTEYLKMSQLEKTIGRVMCILADCAITRHVFRLPSIEYLPKAYGRYSRKWNALEEYDEKHGASVFQMCDSCKAYGETRETDYGKLCARCCEDWYGITPPGSEYIDWSTTNR